MFRSSVFFQALFAKRGIRPGKYGLHVGRVTVAAGPDAPATGAAVEVGAYCKSTTPWSWEQEVVKMDVGTAISCALLEHSQ